MPSACSPVFDGRLRHGANYHLRHASRGWRRKLTINLTGGIYTAVVVLIFATAQFTEGAWLVVMMFPVRVFAFDPRLTGSTAPIAGPENIGDGGSGEPQPRPTHSPGVGLRVRR